MVSFLLGLDYPVLNWLAVVCLPPTLIISSLSFPHFDNLVVGLGFTNNSQSVFLFTILLLLNNKSEMYEGKGTQNEKEKKQKIN